MKPKGGQIALPFFVMNDLILYLKDPQSFEHGLELLRKYNPASSWLNVLTALGESSYTRGTLQKVLKEYLETQKQLKQEEKLLSKLPEATLSNSEAANAPLEIKQIVERRKQLFKEANRKHFELVLFVESYFQGKPTLEPDEAKEAVFELRKTLEESDELWEQTNHFDKYGVMLPRPENVKLELKAGESLERRLRTIKTYLTPSYLSKIPDDRREQHIANVQAEILKIETHLTEQAEEYQYERLN